MLKLSPLRSGFPGNVKRLQELIEWTYYQSDGRAKLMVTGEYALMGTYRPRSIDEWLGLALPGHLPPPPTPGRGARGGGTSSFPSSVVTGIF